MLNPACKQCGAAAVEFQIVALLAMLPMCLGILQIALLLVVNHQLDYATFWAARAGAVAQGMRPDIERAFAQAMTPLFVNAADGIDKANAVQRITAAYPRLLREVALYARFQILSPSAAAGADFGIEREGQRVIPNDSLEHRSMQVGASSGQTLQEANVLKVAVTWCHPLIVPFVSQLLIVTLRLLDQDVTDQVCYAAGRLPLRSTGIASMQSDFRLDL
jgi:TadE-like protein